MTCQILVTEDNELIREHIKEELEERGYNICTTENGQSCLDQIKKSIPDILILDIMMEGITGMEVIRKLKQTKRTKNIYIIANTIITKDSREGQTIASFVDAYIEKPARIDVLMSAVKNGVEYIKSRP
ncbi:MAG: response regulator [Proteobacteria bacterium]|nr:response regulator [Pseudomonadota bacterium]